MVINMLTKLQQHRWIGPVIMFLFMLAPSIAGAEEENPIRKLREKLKFRWDVMNNMDFLFMIVMIVITLICIAAFLYIFYNIISHVIKSQRGKAELGDKKFWITAGGSLLILFLFISGGIFQIFESFYDWQNGLNIGSNK